MRRKLISILLTAVIIIGAIPVLTYADGDTVLAEKGEFTYTLTSDPDTGTPLSDEELSAVAGGDGWDWLGGQKCKG